MLEILLAIDKTLDIKAVQWLLLASLIVQICAGIVFSFRYNALRMDNAFLEKNVAQMASGLAIQNDRIKSLAEQTKTKQENYTKAVNESAKVALETKRTLEGLGGLILPSDCNDKVAAALQALKGRIDSNGK